MSTNPSPDTENVDANDFNSYLTGNAAAALENAGESWDGLIAAIAAGLVSAAVQMVVFFFLRWRLTRIYRPRTYLVPPRERIALPPHGIIGWVKPVFVTPSLHFIQKCGLDAYFFIRYLRMLLKIFAPMLVIICPILLPINQYSDDPNDEEQQEGLGKLTIANVGSRHAAKRLWAHLILAVLAIVWILYNIYEELRGYIRVRQAYLASPQHRIRASATTVLVTGIPKKWLTVEALDGLYDVFPGGIRNIWINRNYDDIADKISKRNDFAQSLEEAETNLIKLCRKRHEKATKKERKRNKSNGTSKDTNEGQELSPLGDSDDARSSETVHGTHLSPNARPEPPRIPTDVLPSPYAEANGQIPRPPNTRNNLSKRKESDEQPLRDSQETAVEAVANATHEPKETPGQDVTASKWQEKLMFWKTDPVIPAGGYPEALSEEFDNDKDEDASWRKYIEPKHRETIRLPVVNQDWFPALPLMGKKVDRIYHCRRELARLNAEIEADQNNAENFPYMNSAFIQFNHQVAAHMACQSVSHHVPQHMAPRHVEISPDDVLWDNMSIKWWERYVRIGIVTAISAALIILYAVPVTFSSFLANITQLSSQVSWLAWLNDFPSTAKSIIEGILPPILLQLILVLVPIIYRVLVKFQGVPTGNSTEMGVQKWYFVFLFIQIFLVVTLTNGLLNFITAATSDVVGTAGQLAKNLPRASVYFFKYLMLRSFSSAAGELLQIGTLIVWFLLGPILDSTPRQKWTRQTTLSRIKWGSFFPPFSNFAVIGIAYACIAPLMLVFMVLIFGLFWVVYRYNVLYVYQFKNDTGGLLFPTAVYQLFTGIYVMEIALAAYFFTQVSDGSKVACIPHAIIMLVCFFATVIYHRILASTFAPLERYMPITLEDDAVIRDEEFARAQAARFERPSQEEQQENEKAEAANFEHQLKERERDEEQQEAADVPEPLGGPADPQNRRLSKTSTPSNSWAKRDGSSTTWGKAAQPVKGVINLTGRAEKRVERMIGSANTKIDQRITRANGVQNPDGDEEGHKTVADVLFAGIADELEDLTPDERDLLVRYAFQHSALRARRPVVWFPKDELGVSDDEVRRGKAVSEYLAMSNEGAVLDRKGKVRFERSPPDFSNVDLIAL
ncbi:hypothetical protein Q7P37_011018 [Cladosporium fusiforme]